MLHLGEASVYPACTPLWRIYRFTRFCPFAESITYGRSTSLLVRFRPVLSAFQQWIESVRAMIFSVYPMCTLRTPALPVPHLSGRRINQDLTRINHCGGSFVRLAV